MARRVWLAAVVMLLAATSRSIGQAPGPAGAQRIWTLEDAVIAALAQHPLVEAARARIDAARSERDGVRAVANPVGTFWMENDRPRESSLYFTYPIESIFQRGPRVRRADEDIRAAAASLTLARRLVAAETVRAFFGVALAQALHEEAEENRDRLEQLVSCNRARVGEGVTAEGELLRLEVELAVAANDVVLSVATSTGSEVQRPLATVVIGGLMTSTLLTLIVLPVLYQWLEERWPAWAATIHKGMRRRRARTLGEAHV